jgi:hypothetical protein
VHVFGNLSDEPSVLLLVILGVVVLRVPFADERIVNLEGHVNLRTFREFRRAELALPTLRPLADDDTISSSIAL